MAILTHQKSQSYKCHHIGVHKGRNTQFCLRWGLGFSGLSSICIGNDECCLYSNHLLPFVHLLLVQFFAPVSLLPSHLTIPKLIITSFLFILLPFLLWQACVGLSPQSDFIEHALSWVPSPVPAVKAIDSWHTVVPSS